MRHHRVLAAWSLFALVALMTVRGAAETGLTGQVTSGGMPVPGATVTASQDGKPAVTTVADREGRYNLPQLADGAWTIRVEMLGFEAASQAVTVGPETPPANLELTLLSFEAFTRGREVQRGEATAAAPDPKAGASPAPTSPGAARGAAPPSGRGAAPQNAASPAAAAPPPPIPESADSALAADGLLINGSVNNGAASPFAQAAAFGNNRRGVRSLYNGSLGGVFGNSAFDARPYSFTSERGPKPSYNDAQVLVTFGGPLRIPGLLRTGPNMFVGYQRTTDHSATTQSALLPTLRERDGDFSQSVDRFGRPIVILDPSTGLPFQDNAIPKDRISRQASALLGYYPQPNLDEGGRFNFQRPILTSTQQDNLQVRGTQTVMQRNTIAATLAYSRTRTEGANLFGFVDANRTSGLDVNATWSRRFSQLSTTRFRYQFLRQSTDVTPFFSGRTNVSGEAGIAGNAQDADNWGPPNLVFSSGIAGFAGQQFAANDTSTHGWGGELLRLQGRHSLTIGGGGKRTRTNVRSQQDARGSFGFTGATTGSDFADFLLGVPQTASIAFGNADKRFRASLYELYLNDDWRVSPSLTVNAGLRWEYETPITEAQGRLANLDVASDFSVVSPVTADNPLGPITGEDFGASLLRPDKRGLQPRLGLAWRPLAGSSLVVRAGYGIYRNTNVYQSIALLLAQQPPLSKALSLSNSAATPLTLATGFVGSPNVALNTFAVDPDFRVSAAHNWQLSAQRDLPGSLTVIGTYLGSRGTNLMQEFLPNTTAPGAVSLCAVCPTGFAYLTSHGTSVRHAGSIEVRRRLRAGFTSTVRYTLSKATDNAAAFSGAALGGASIAQDWLDLEAERGPSNFDQRHLMTVQAQYTTGVGVAGGALLTGVTGALVKNWTITAQLTTGSGSPVTPVYLGSIAGSGITGSIRAATTGADPDEVPDGYYLNPAAYGIPGAGLWGDAGRNSITGPAQFSLNGGITRTFLFGTRLNLDWRLDVTNLLNRVTYSGINTLVGSPQFGLPNRANTMRKIQSTMRLRF